MESAQLTTTAVITIITGLIYSATMGATTPTLPPSPPCDPSLEDQNFVDQPDCTPYYYRCVYGRKVSKECPEKMLFNPAIGNCDLYYNVDCARKNVDEDDLSDVVDNFTAKPGKIVSETTSVDEVTLKFVYFPHEKLKNAYYKVENGVRTVLYCQRGMVFSFDMEICARPWDTDT